MRRLDGGILDLSVEGTSVSPERATAVPGRGLSRIQRAGVAPGLPVPPDALANTDRGP